MAHHGVNRPVTERRHQSQGIAYQVQHAKRADIAIVVTVPARGTAIAALIGRDHVITGLRDRQHHFAPTVRKLRKAMQQQHARSSRRLVARLQDVHPQTVDVVDKARADAPRQGILGITSELTHCFISVTLLSLGAGGLSFRSVKRCRPAPLERDRRMIRYPTGSCAGPPNLSTHPTRIL